jgi:hypothetical protein
MTSPPVSRLFGVFALVSALGGAAFVVQLTRAPYDAFAPGTVVELVPRRPGADREPPMTQAKDDYLARIQFTAADGRVVTVEHDRARSASRDFRAGDTVNVNYDSADPERFVLPLPGERTSILLPVAAAWLLVNGVFWTGARLHARRRAAIR